MTYFPWDKRFSVSIESIDLQHQTLILLLNRLHHAIKEGEEIDIEEVVQKLKNYCHYHFTSEEFWMERLGYPDLGRHRILHRNFIQKIKRFEEKIARKEISRLEVLAFMKRWVVHHIQKEDQLYAAYFRKRGVDPGIFKQEQNELSTVE